MKVHTFETTSDVDESGQYVSVKHVSVNFILQNLADIDLRGFNLQNVISGLELQKADDGYELTLCGCYGLEGWLRFEGLRIVLEPGIPEGNIYAKYLRE